MINENKLQNTQKTVITQSLNPLKVLAINSSPRKDQGNTSLILTPFLKGLEKNGSEVELIYTNDLSIKPCFSDLTCMLRPDGRCIHQDDMNWLIPKIQDADILVLASPLYMSGVSGPLKMLMDRMIPLLDILIDDSTGHQRHPLKIKKIRKVVLVSSCGFWEIDNFDPLVTHIQEFSKNMSAEYVGALIRPHGPSLGIMMNQGLPVQDILDAAFESGIQLAREGGISSDYLTTISRELIPPDMYLQMSNAHFNEIIAEMS